MAVVPAWVQLFVDVPRAEWDAATRFWAQVTGCSLSPARGEDGQFVTLLPHTGPAWVKLQAVGGGGGVHLDLDGVDRDAAVARALDLGGSVEGTYHDVVVMTSPGGFTFCQTLLDPAEPRPRMVRGATAVLDQVCLDVPGGLWADEVAFWGALTGRTLQPGLRPEFAFLGDGDPDGPVRILLQRLDEDAGPVRGHPDLAVADRRGQEARHTAAGAELLDRFDRWTVLRAPGGQVYCLTDRDPSTGQVRRGLPTAADAAGFGREG